MAQTNFTPISLYYSTTAAAVPTAGNLVAGELAINTADGKLFYKDSAGVVQVIGTKGGVGSSTTTQVLYNSSGLVVGSANLTFNGTTLTVNDLTDSSLTATRVVYAGTAGNLTNSANMTFSGTALTLANDASISGLTVGKGGGAVGSNTAVGNGSMAATATGTNNTAIGVSSLPALTSGTVNTAIGASTLFNNTTGGLNTAVGRQALFANTTASNNTAVGVNAMVSNTTGETNTALGVSALQANTTASNNTAVGYQAGYTGTTAAGNTYVGNQAGYFTTTGTNNTYLGNNSGVNMTTGSKNTIVGIYSGNQGGLDIRTSSNRIVLSDGDGNPRGYFDSDGNFFVGATAFGTSSTKIITCGYLQSTNNVSTSTTLQVWNQGTTGDNKFIEFYTEGGGGSFRGSVTYNRAGGLTAYNVTSDYRAKDIISPVLNSGEVIDSVPVYMGKMKGATQARPMFIAHETPNYAHTGEKDAVDKDGNPIYQQMDSSSLVPVLWAEIQSLRKRVAQLESK
jgi:hypothetical protein